MTTFEKILSDNEKYNKCANNYELVSSLKDDYTEIYTKLRYIFELCKFIPLKIVKCSLLSHI